MIVSELPTTDAALPTADADAAADAVRVLAFHLPQYHPIPENDAWWGPGFTEWTNVVKGRPRFRGHYQPHLPADLGYYDLRLPEARAAQADLARAYGVGGFCYYHYWFHGKRLLERPVLDVVAGGEPDFPLCLCWANESWNRAWDGAERQVLIEQRFSEEDDRQHLQALAPILSDPRYVRVHGRPLFLIYKSARLPDPARTCETMRQEATRLGLGELYLCRVEAGGETRGDPRLLGFDAAVEFQPDTSMMRGSWWRKPERLAHSLGLGRLGLAGSTRICEYADLVEAAVRQPDRPYPRFPGVTVSFDNSVRRRHAATVLRGSTPELYERWLRHALAKAGGRPPGERLVFVNAWNEWAEGNHLEPDERFGHGYLEATRRATSSTRATPAAVPRQ